jgi:hypothetical protein
MIFFSIDIDNNNNNNNKKRICFSTLTFWITALSSSVRTSCTIGCTWSWKRFWLYTCFSCI